MRTWLKVCGIESIEEVKAAVAAGVNALGFVSEMPSGSGMIPDSLITELAGAVPPPVCRVLLTSRTDPDAVVAHAIASHVDTLQLVAAVPEATYIALRHFAPHIRIVQVLHVEGREIVERAQEVAPLVHAILLDSGRPGALVPELGGTGRQHDWALSRQVVEAVPQIPVFLAGGINASNVTKAIHQVRPYGIDLCSGVRTEGRLDAAKLEALLSAMAIADAALTQKA